MPNIPDVPVVETQRLSLRGHRPDDLADCARMWADPDVTRYIGGRPFSEEDVWARMLRYAGHWSWFGFGYWLIEEKTTSQFVGEIGFANHRREIQPPIHGIPELGWALSIAMSGKGYATEAARAAIQWFESRFEHSRTVCLIAPGNTASIHVAIKCRYTKVHDVIYGGHPTVLFARQGSQEAQTDLR